ncbi:MAG: hypothetical protein AB7K09_12430 [Planctomycetota bacterium]
MRPIPQMVFTLLLAGAVLMPAAKPAAAQDGADEMSRRIAQLEAELKALRERVAVLERARAERAAEAAPELPPHARYLSFDVPGYVTDLPTPGPIARGYAVARLYNQDLMLETDQARTRTRAAEAAARATQTGITAAVAAEAARKQKLDAAAEALARVQQLARQGLAAQAEVEAAATALDVARIDLARATMTVESARAAHAAALATMAQCEAEENRAGEMVARFTLWAPTSGYVLRVLVPPGTLVTAGQPVVIFGAKPVRQRGPDQLIKANGLEFDLPSFWKPYAISGRDALVGLYGIGSGNVLVTVTMFRVAPADAAKEADNALAMFSDVSDRERLTKTRNGIEHVRTTVFGTFTSGKGAEKVEVRDEAAIVATLVSGEHAIVIRLLGEASLLRAEADDFHAFLDSARLAGGR